MEMNGDKPATKKELDESIQLVQKDLNEQVGLVRKDLGDQIGLVRKDLGDQIGLVRKDLGDQIGLVRKDLDEKVGLVRSDLEKNTATLDKVAMRVINLESNLAGLQATVATKDDIKALAVTMANFAGRVEGYDKNEVSRSAVMDEHGKVVRDHERRISRLETGGQDYAGISPS